MQGVALATDTGVRELILRQIASDPEVLSTDINVSVEGCVVTLTGFVHSYFEKLAAENVAKHTDGVIGIANDIVVKLGSEPTDPEIAREALRALHTDPELAAEDISITVKNRFVTVEGEVHEYSEKLNAERALTTLHGIKGVANRLEIR